MYVVVAARSLHSMSAVGANAVNLRLRTLLEVTKQQTRRGHVHSAPQLERKKEKNREERKKNHTL